MSESTCCDSINITYICLVRTCIVIRHVDKCSLSIAENLELICCRITAGHASETCHLLSLISFEVLNTDLLVDHRDNHIHDLRYVLLVGVQRSVGIICDRIDSTDTGVPDILYRKVLTASLIARNIPSCELL